MEIQRYATDLGVISWRDPFEDLVVQLQFLNSPEYIVDVARRVHGIKEDEGKLRADLIASHARSSDAFIDQAMSGRTHTAFLPLYYAILNLLKIYILLSNRHADLPKHRWHGATYDGYGKTSHSLLTEQITLKAGGAIPLFYQVVTGESILGGTKIKIGDICPYIVDASSELSTATGEKRASPFAKLTFNTRNTEAGRFRPVVTVTPAEGRTVQSVSQLKVLRGFRKDPVGSGVYLGKDFATSGSNRLSDVRSQLRLSLLYHPLPSGFSITPISAKKLLLPEELPIALLFFYMSSVTRYRPDYLDRLMDSKYWPFLSIIRATSLTKFLFLFWSFVQQANYCIARD